MTLKYETDWEVEGYRFAAMGSDVYSVLVKRGDEHRTVQATQAVKNGMTTFGFILEIDDEAGYCAPFVKQVAPEAIST